VVSTAGSGGQITDRNSFATDEVSGSELPGSHAQHEPSRRSCPAKSVEALKDRSGDRHLAKKRCAVSALRKGSGLKGPGRTPGNGISGRRWKQELRLGNTELFYEAFVQIIVLEIAKRTVRSSVRNGKTSVRTLLRSRPPPKQKKRLLEVLASTDRKNKKWWSALDYFGRAALTREQCGMSTERQNCEASKGSRC
jgi:hypothetical protein